MTPNRSDSHRGKEIQEWLTSIDEEIESYVILDDDIYDLRKEHKGHIIQTSWKNGLKPKATKEAIKILNKKECQNEIFS